MEIINEYFQDIVNDQGYLETQEQWRKVLQLIPLRYVCVCVYMTTCMYVRIYVHVHTTYVRVCVCVVCT